MTDFITADAHIWRLPNELLRDIFSLAAALTPDSSAKSRLSDYKYDVATVKAIILTSRRCHDSAVCFLYHSLSLRCFRGDDHDGNDDGEPYMPGKGLKQILENLQSKPLLGNFCVSLNLSIRRKVHASETPLEAASATPYAFEPLIPFLPQVRRLRIDHTCAFRDQALRNFLGYCAALMPKLHTLILTQEMGGGGPTILTIDQCSQFKSLRELKFSGVSDLDIAQFKNILVKEGIGLKTLLIGESLTSQGLKKLLHWPRNLEKVAIGPPRTDYDWISLKGLHANLLKHRECLTHLHVTNLAVERPGIHCDFTAFANLKYLRIPMRQMTQEPDGDTQDAIRILAPRLEQFILFISHKHVDGSWIAFNDNVKRFVRTLAEKAIVKRLPLREIHISFDITVPRSGTQDQDAWKQIQDLDEEFRQRGVAIAYSYYKGWVHGVDEQF